MTGLGGVGVESREGGREDQNENEHGGSLRASAASADGWSQSAQDPCWGHEAKCYLNPLSREMHLASC